MPVRLPNPFNMFNRASRRAADTYVRRFDGAAGGRRGFGLGTFGQTQTEVSAAAHVVRSRGRYLTTNNPLISNAVANWVAALVGAGIVPTGAADGVGAFLAWADTADAEQRTDFWGLQADIARAMVVDGEAFVQLIMTESGLRLRLIPAEQVDESKNGELAGGGYVDNGVEFDVDGLRVAYHRLARETDRPVRELCRAGPRPRLRDPSHLQAAGHRAGARNFVACAGHPARQRI